MDFGIVEVRQSGHADALFAAGAFFTVGFGGSHLRGTQGVKSLGLSFTVAVPFEGIEFASPPASRAVSC